jgi:hypothetical protein
MESTRRSSIVLIVGILAGIIGCVLWTCSTRAISEERDSKPRLVQPTPDCSDFDVIPVGWEHPAFRLLLPEHISAEGPKKIGFAGTHTISGRWGPRRAGLRGSFRTGEVFEITVDLMEDGNSVNIEIATRNLTAETLRQVRMIVCSSVNHLPGNPNWSNRLFIPPEIPEDRHLQGLSWYEHVTPQRLRALRPSGWITTHPSPHDPDPGRVPRYNFVPSATADTKAYAVQSVDGEWLFYQTWDRPSRHASPCHGNACMHLHPLVAEHLEPGATAVIRGRAGLFRDDWEALRTMIERRQRDE